MFQSSRCRREAAWTERWPWKRINPVKRPRFVPSSLYVTTYIVFTINHHTDAHRRTSSSSKCVLLVYLQQVESTEAPDKDVELQISDGPDDAAGSDSLTEIKENTDTPEEVKDGASETSSKFFCYICNITCHNQQVSFLNIVYMT